MSPHSHSGAGLLAIAGGIRPRLLGMIFVAMAPLVAVHALVLHNDRKAAIMAAGERAANVARQGGDLYRQRISGARSVLAVMAQVPQAVSGTPEECAAFLKSAERQSVWNNGFWVANRDGRVVCTSVAGGIGLDISQRDYFRRALSSRELVVSDFIRGKLRGQPATVAALPIVRSNGEIERLLLVTLQLGWFSELTREIAAESDASVWLLDSTGHIVAQFPDRPEQIGADFRQAGLLAEMALRQQGWAEIKDETGGNRIVGYRTDPHTNARIIVSFDKAAVLARIDREITNAGYALLLALILAALMSIGFARAISGPLKLLTIGAEAARHSSRHALPRVRGYREVASLAESLNALLNDRRQREEALSLARAEAERAEREANTAHARLRDAIEAVPAGVVLFDNEDRYVLWNSRYEELYSESRNMLRPGLRFEDRLRAAIALGQYPLAIGREEEWLAQRLANHHRDSSDHEQRLPGDRWVKIEERRTRDGRIGIRTDITELKRREASFRLLFDSNPLPMWVIDLESLRFIAVNSAAIAHYGYREEQFLAMTVDQLWPADDRAATRLAATRDLSSNAGRGGRHVTADGTEIHVQIFSRALTYAQRPAKIAAIIDVTERRRAEARITHMAHHDELTGLANRTLFRERLEEALARARRSGDGLAVHCIDLDNFKTVNDTLGHPIGDVLLRMVAERLLQCIRETDTVARLGGDEFAVIQDGIGDPQAAGNLAQRLIDAMSDPFAIEGHEVAASSSIGIATAIRGEEDADLLLRNADMALYRAKSAGRRTFCFFEPEMDAHLQARRKMELDLRTALARQEFEVHYQPIIDLASNRLDGFEALLRWNHPQRGPVSPAQFIPIAEEAGLIVSIGEWVLRQACNEAMTWPDDTAIAVNLSPVQFMSGNIVQAVITALAVSGLPAGRLELEITESVLFEDNDVNLATLHRLRLLGVRVALDDFGTGYSSLSVLRRFPFDKIKIDRSFVGELAHNPDCLAISQGIIALASGLGMKTTAEGVETRDQADILRAGGCDSAQGYLYGAARPGCDSRAFIASSRMAAQSAA